MTPESISDLRERFTWTADKRDGWSVLRGEGPLRGDCDDFAVTALMVVEGSWFRWWGAVIRRRAYFWRCLDRNGVGHMLLHHRRHGWIDNQNPDWSDVPGFVPELRFPRRTVAIRVLIGRFFR